MNLRIRSISPWRFNWISLSSTPPEISLSLPRHEDSFDIFENIESFITKECWSGTGPWLDWKVKEAGDEI